jgi:DNA ligase (NAD+)
MPFQLISDGKVQYATKEDEFLALGEIGFTNIPNCHITPKVGRKKFSALATVFSIYKKYVDTVRDSLDYEIDGLVVCLNDNAKWAAAGERNHRPAGSIAFKFPHDSAKTVLRNIVWQVGNTGRVTPVAEFDSVSLAGANVRRASLHNVSNIKRIAAEYGDCYGLGAGDTIMVSRRNDVIPYVESLVSTMNPSHNFEGIHPNECPECQTSLVFEGEYLVCPNTLSCPAQVSGGIKRWIKKVGILDWGDAIIEALCEDGMVNDPADLYKLTYDQLSALELSGRVVGTAAERMLTNLHDKKELPLNVFVGSLGIPLVARSMCKIIVDAGYDTIDKMAAATENEISSIHGVGGTKAQSFVEGFRFRSGLISKLMMQGITIKQPSNGALTGMTVCMTGFRDAVMQEAIESAGGTIKSGVVKNLTYLVSKDPNSTSGKAKKARAQGTTVIGQDDMWEILGV